MYAQSDVVRRTNSGYIPLTATTAIGDPVIVFIPLEADATLDAENKAGVTAPLMAKKKGHHMVYEFIIEESRRWTRQAAPLRHVQSLLSKRG